LLLQVNVPPAAADCEAISSQWWGQPVNTATALAFLVAAVVVFTRTGKRTIALALVLTGVGSLLFHGPMPPFAEWAHDVSLTWLIVVITTSGTRWERAGGWASLLGLALLIALVPALGDPVAVGLSVIGALRLLRIGNTLARVGLVVLAMAGIVGRLSATGGPWCRPDSWIQGHGLWHLGAATAVVFLALARPQSDRPQRLWKNTPPSPHRA
jgi:hypothetical protein